MAKYSINDTTLIKIADAIRYQSETTDPINPLDMAPMIMAFKTDGLPAEVFRLTGNCNYKFY